MKALKYGLILEDKKVTGFAQVSKVYFDKQFNEISNSEYISLVAMLIGPNGFHVINKPRKNQARSTQIKRLLEGKYNPTGVFNVYHGEDDA